MPRQLSSATPASGRRSMSRSFTVRAYQPSAGFRQYMDAQQALGRRFGVFSMELGNPERVSRTRKWLFDNVIGNQKVDILVGVVIVLNLVVIGWEQQVDTGSGSEEDAALISAFVYLEHTFISFYLIEMLLRFFVLGRKCLADHWMKIDVILVLIGVVSTWFLEPLLRNSGGQSVLSMLRVLRLFRLARTVRLLVKVKTFLIIVRGLGASAVPVMTSVVLLILILYILSCVGYEVLTQSEMRYVDDECGALIRRYFPDMSSNMLTLLRFVWLDSISDIYTPLIKKQGWLVLYFGAVLLMGPIVLMNLVTAVIVNGAFSQAESDRAQSCVNEAQKEKELISELRTIFEHLDDDRSGTVSREEIEAIDAEDQKLLNQLGKSFQDPIAIFNALDLDGRGELSINEFCDGIWQLAISKVPLEMQRMEKQVNDIHRYVRRIREQMQEQKENVESERKKLVSEVVDQVRTLLVVQLNSSAVANAAPGTANAARIAAQKRASVVQPAAATSPQVAASLQATAAHQSVPQVVSLDRECSFFTPRQGSGDSAEASTELPAACAAASSVASRDFGSAHLAGGAALDPNWGSPLLAALGDLLRTTGLHMELLHKILQDNGGSQAPRAWPPDPALAGSSTLLMSESRSLPVATLASPVTSLDPGRGPLGSRSPRDSGVAAVPAAATARSEGYDNASSLVPIASGHSKSLLIGQRRLDAL